MSKRRAPAIVASLLALSLSLAACGGATPGAQPNTGAQAKGPKVVTMAMWSAPNNFSPLSTDSDYGFMAVAYMIDSLVNVTEQGTYVPRLAQKWEPNADHTQYTFHLNPAAKWTDGQPVTADDVKWTFDTISNPDVASNRGGSINMLKGTDASGKSPAGKVDGVQVVDAHTITFATKTPADESFFLTKIGTEIYPLPKHVLGQVAPAELLKHPYFQNPTVTDGAFKFNKYATDQYIEYDKNPDYYLGTPKLDKLVIKIVKPTSMVAALQKGEIDMTLGAGLGEVPVTDWDKVKAMSNLNTISVASSTTQYMNINLQFKPFADQRVRQAMVYAINRPLIADRLLKGEAEIWDSPFGVITNYLDSSVKPWAYDANKAKELLKAANWDPNTEVELLVPTGNIVREQSAPIIAQNLQDAGFKVKVQKLDFASLQAKLRSGQFQLALVGWGITTEPDVSNFLASGAEYNRGKFNSKTIDDLLAKGRSTADPKERKQIYSDLQKALQTEVPNVFLYDPKGLMAFNKRLVNVHPGWEEFLGYNDYLWDVQ